MDTEELFEKTLGSFGRWHGLFIFLIYLSGFIVSFHALLFIPEHYNMESSCATPDVDMCSNKCESITSDEKYMSKSITTEWNLLCGYTNDIIQTIIFLGFLFGGVILGWFSDKFGRKIPMIVEIVVQIAAGVGAGFAQNLQMFTALRTISAFATGGLMPTTFILLIEGLDKRYRTVFCILFQMTLYISYGIVVLSCFLLHRWDYIQIFLSSLGVLLLPYIFLVHESVRWLLLKKRTEDLVNVLEKMARSNNMPVESVRGAAESCASKVGDTPPGNILDLFRTKRMAIKTVTLCLNWFLTSNLFYVATNLMAPLSLNFYINLAITGAAQVPGNLICLFLSTKYGRKRAYGFGSFLALFPLLVNYLLLKDQKWLRTICTCYSLCGCAMCVSVLFLYSAEMLPTVVRNFGLGFMLQFFWGGLICSQYVMYAEKMWSFTPYMIMCTVICIVCYLDLYFMPDTLNVTIPDTLEDADKL